MVPIIYAISLHGAGFAESIWPDCDQTGYSSVGRASDCRHMQQSDGPWFDSGWPDLRTLLGMGGGACDQHTVRAKSSFL